MDDTLFPLIARKPYVILAARLDAMPGLELLRKPIQEIKIRFMSL